MKWNSWDVIVQYGELPGMIGCPVMLMGGIPRLFMAVAQALGSDMGIAKELESMVILLSPSETEKNIIWVYI